MSEIQISASDVKKLRDITGAGMMDCKQALGESNGDFDGAIEYLRKKGQKLSVKRADRDAKEGVVIALVTDDNKQGIVLRLSSETDFVSKNEDFVNLTKAFAQIALDKMPANLDELLACKYESITIGDKVTEQVGVIGEKIEIADYQKLEGAMIIPYIHMGYRAGVIVQLSKANPTFETAGKDIAMQIAAMKPIAVDKANVDSSVAEKEIEIGKDIARQEGKPEEMLEKIAMGKLNKFFKENTLLNQDFVKDGSKTVAAYLKDQDPDLTVVEFKHIMLG